MKATDAQYHFLRNNLLPSTRAWRRFVGTHSQRNAPDWYYQKMSKLNVKEKHEIEEVLQNMDRQKASGLIGAVKSNDYKKVMEEVITIGRNK